MKKLLRIAKLTLGKSIFYSFLLVSFAFTVYIFATSIEVLTKRDIEYVYTVHETNIEVLASESVQDSQVELSKLYFPGHSSSIELLPAIIKNAEFYQQTSKAHYIVYSQDPVFEIADALIYTNENFRTVIDPAVVFETGSVFSVSTRNQLLTYKVLDVSVLPSGQKFIFPQSDDNNLVLVVTNDKKGTTTYVTSILIGKN